MNSTATITFSVFHGRRNNRERFTVEALRHKFSDGHSVHGDIDETIAALPVGETTFLSLSNGREAQITRESAEDLQRKMDTWERAADGLLGSVTRRGREDVTARILAGSAR